MTNTTPTSPATQQHGSPKSGLQLTSITDDMGDDDINCDCPGHDGRPADDQVGVTCGTCNKWQHYSCMVGEKPLTTADVTRGYQCRLCRRTKRSEAAKKGYQNRLLAQGTPQSTKSAPAGTRGSSVTPLSKFKVPKLQVKPARKIMQAPGEDEDDEEEEVVHHRQTRKGGYTTRSKLAITTSAPRSDPPRKPMPHSKSLNDVINEWKKNNPPGTPSMPRRERTSAPRRQLPHPQITAGVIKAWLAKPTPRNIFCDCPGGPVGHVRDYVVCYNCKRLQHKVCMHGVKGKQDSVLKGDFCKECRRARYKQHLKAFAQNQHEARSLARRQQHNVTDFCEKVLWKLYCQLPAGEASAAVRELTSMYYDNGKMISIHPAPKEWVAEIRSRLVKMTAAAGEEKIGEMRGPDGASLRYNEQSMVAWRKLAVWMLHHGPYKKKRAELGVLAEVLGLEEKGRVWKG
ncbi:hypothetical protein LTR85_006326 [Meristemomyces frigidus]|nr:hypothetical protein LTR85_006326 [Meristemomyces frigidus]